MCRSKGVNEEFENRIHVYRGLIPEGKLYFVKCHLSFKVTVFSHLLYCDGNNSDVFFFASYTISFDKIAHKCTCRNMPRSRNHFLGSTFLETSLLAALNILILLRRSIDDLCTHKARERVTAAFSPEVFLNKQRKYLI